MTLPALHTLQSKLKLAKALVFLGFLAGFLLSPGLWTNKRFFPLLGPIDGLPAIAYPFDIILLSAFLVSGAIWVFYNKRSPGLCAMGILAIILVQDQMRWQPWVYQYCLLLLPYLLQSDTQKNGQSILYSQQWILGGIYVWSGIQKLNPEFLSGTFIQITEALGIEQTFSQWKYAGYSIPLFEILTGLSLLSARLRKAGICMAAITHITILVILNPWMMHHNSIVYPWNIMMLLLVFVLYGGADAKRSAFDFIRKKRVTAYNIIPVLLVWICPLLNFAGYWDHYLSFSLYSDKPPTFYIAVAESELPKIDLRLQHYFVVLPGLQGGQLIDIDKWAFSELNVPFYPQLRLFKKLGYPFCNLNIAANGILFIEASSVDGIQQYKTFTCATLTTP